MTATRRLAAILAADMVGYLQLIGADEEGTLNRGIGPSIGSADARSFQRCNLSPLVDGAG
jgi:hypothetical protein